MVPTPTPTTTGADAEVDGIEAAAAWFAGRGWRPHAFQREVWQAMAEGRSGLLHATTGSGKTYAVWLGALARARARADAGTRGLQVLWLTPMRALAADTAKALQAPLADLAPGWTIGQRTGDTAAAERARQDRLLPPALVTTPESLSLLLTRATAQHDLGRVHTVVVDEWHELVSSKRGVQVQLALARLRRWNPDVVVWGLSATLGNLDEAMDTLVGATGPAPAPRLVQGRLAKALVIDTLLPPDAGRFSWGGHLGAQMVQPVVDEIAGSGTTLVFTNTRAQAEIWYQLLLQQRPDWAGVVALHHGSLARGVREWVEAGLKDGSLRAVVATSSLDLGVDFLPVERVLQIGSPKGVARLLQRAGRSGHAPGLASRVTLVPTHTMELVEAAAVRQAALAGVVEPRRSPDKPLDVLVQHLVTVALGGGFEADADGGAAALRDEVRGCRAYRDLSDDEFAWALAFVERGGDSLTAYPDYHRIARVDGRWTVPDRAVARRHRMQVGTIVSDATMQVKWMNGASLGSVEEGFIARLRKGDCFVFSGRLLEYLRTHDMVAYVKPARRAQGAIPTWGGSRMALSGELAEAVQALLEEAADGVVEGPEMRAAQPMLATQARLSSIPRPDRLLVERLRSREGHHLFLYPFAGRSVHIGLAQLLAWRLGQREANSFSLSVNDYGLEILSAKPVDFEAARADGLFAAERLTEDVLASLNSGELAQRRFREIARIAGLVFGGFPGQPKSMRQLQASSSLFFEVFRKYDAGNRLLQQAEREVLAQELDIRQLAARLRRLAALPVELVELAVTSPFALPLRVDRMREQFSTEQLKDKLDRLLAESEAALDEAVPARPKAARRRVVGEGGDGAGTDGKTADPLPAKGAGKARGRAGLRLVVPAPAGSEDAA